jgi:hypothetical protein
MGAANRLDDRLEARLSALQLDYPHGAVEQPRPPDDVGATDPLPLDREELEMLAVFHKSFNLPGLRYGLVTPVAKDDYYPPEEHNTNADQSEALQAGLRAQARTSDLLRQASELLGGEAAEVIEEEITSTPDGGQSELARWMAQPESEPRRSPQVRRCNSSAAPIRTESRPRTGGSAASHRSATAIRGGGLRSDYPL